MLGQTGGAPPEIAQWVQVGIAGLVIIGFLMGWIWPRPPVEQLRKDIDRLNQKVEEQDKWMREIVVPALNDNSHLHKEVIDYLRHDEPSPPPIPRRRT